MAEFERKLAAVVSADVVGYSRLMGLDETGTLGRLKALREELIEPRITACRGRVVKLMGDGILIEFASATDAVSCAVEVQRELAARNESVPEDQRLVFRVGINLGEIIVDGDDIHGDGVNIAARLEALARPGGVCISGKVFAEVHGKLALDHEFAGLQQLKNIAAPVPVYRLLPGGQGGDAAADGGRRRSWRSLTVAAIVVVLLGVVGAAAWHVHLRDTKAPTAVSQRPSIAVLPFANLSDAPDQEYFSDGITEDVITDLSKISGLLVIARTSVFVYKGRPVPTSQVRDELGVSHVLEGSVRKAGGRVRITAQLIDAETGFHL